MLRLCIFSSKHDSCDNGHPSSEYRNFICPEAHTDTPSGSKTREHFLHCFPGKKSALRFGNVVINLPQCKTVHCVLDICMVGDGPRVKCVHIKLIGM